MNKDKLAFARNPDPMLHLDHILYAVPNLQKGTEDFEKLTGVQPAYGGKHTHLGTHNALISLGEEVYLELIAPDPTQSIPFENVIFDIGKIKVPKIITWAVRSTNINELGSRIQISKIEDGKRIKEDGTSLKWKTAGITEFADNSGIVPFVIQWISIPHPANTSPGGCELLEFSAEHPCPNKLTKLLSELSFSFKIVKSQSVRLKAKINSPKGVVEIC